MSYQRRYKLKDDRFGLLALTLRERVRLRQAEVASVLHVSLRTIQHWEGGTTYPSITNLKDLIALYLRTGAFTTEHELEEAKSFWEQAAESASRRKSLFDEAWFDDLLKKRELRSTSSALQEQFSLQTHALAKVDWGEAVDGSTFYGRESELATLQQWVLEEHCRLVLLLGRGGIGKTTLSVRFAQQMLSHVDFVLWRSLRNAPSLDGLLLDCVQALSMPHSTPASGDEGKNIALLIELLRQRRCLLIFDNVESLLQTGTLDGGYRQGYENYGVFFQRIAQTSHQSCLLLTSREMLAELEALEGTHAPVRGFRLAGLGQTASQELLKDKDLFGTQRDWKDLIGHYSGNPLALKIVGATVRDLFNGSIAAFVEEGPIALSTLQQLVHQQFVRLTLLERDVMYWLAIERELVSLEILRNNLPSTLPRSELLSAIKSLRRRGLIERGERIATFTLQPEVMEYVSERFVEQMSEEIIKGSPKLFTTHALLKALSNDDIRESQIRMFVQPLLNQLLTHFGTEQEVTEHLHTLAHTMRKNLNSIYSYGGGNLVNLLSCLKGSLRDEDFSALTIRQAYIQGIEAQGASFANTFITETLFMEPIGSIASMTLSPDGRYLAAGSFSGTICVWRVVDRKLLLTLQSHTRMVWSLAFSPDSTMLASGGYDGTIKLWEIQRGKVLSGQFLKTLSGHERWVRSLTYSRDGTFLVSASDDETIRVWDTHSGTCWQVIQGHHGIIWSVAVSPDGALIVSGGEDETVRVWDTQTGACVKALHAHGGLVMTVAFHPGGEMFASGGEDGSIHVWDAANLCRLTSLQLQSKKAASIAFNPEGTLLTSGSQTGEVEVWQVVGMRDFYRVRTLPGHPIWVSTVAFAVDGLLASISYGGQVKLWEVEYGRCLGTIQGYSNVICALAFSPDGTLLAQGDDHGVVRVWDVQGGSCLKAFQAHAGRIWSIHFSPDGELFASGGDDQGAEVKLWKVKEILGEGNAYCSKTLYGHTAMVWSIAFSPDGSSIGSSGADWTVKIWKMVSQEKGDEPTILEGHTTMVWTVAFSPDGRLLASGDNDGVVKIWDLRSEQCLTTLQKGTSAVVALVFISDDILQSFDNDQNVTVWDVRQEEAQYSLKVGLEQGYVNWAKAAAVNSNGELVALGRDAHRITLGHTTQKCSLANSELQRLSESALGASSSERKAHILGTPLLQRGQVWSVAFSPDSHLLASGDDEGNLVLWDVEAETCRQILRSDRPYEHMNIYGIKGLVKAQIDSLKALGAIEDKDQG